MITEIQDNEFEASIASGLNMVLFYKDKCPFCNAMKKILIKFSARPAAAGKDIRYFQINRETNPQTTEALGVTGIPSLFIYRDGDKIAEKSGDVTYRQLDKMVA